MTTAEIITACRKSPGHQCEMCNQTFFDDPIAAQVGRHNCQFCSDDCVRDAIEDWRVGQQEAAREYEIYGNDCDSWYR